MTIKELLGRTASLRGDAVAIRYKKRGEWRAISYRELLNRAWVAAEALAARGIRPGDRVALYRENAPDWPEMYFAATGIGATVVAVDPKLHEQEVAHILRDSGARMILADAAMYPILREVEPHAPSLERALLVGWEEIGCAPASRVRYEDYHAATEAVADQAGSAGRAYDRYSPRDDDLASIIYTSGTTGQQKGAMLTHANFTSNVSSLLRAIEVRTDDNFLLVLPLHHTFAFTTNLLVPVAVGCQISFVESLKTIGENAAEVSPTVLIAVPLLLEKLYRRIMTSLRENRIGWLLFRLGVREPVRRGILRKLGGRLRLIVTGGAPCDPAIIRGLGELGLLVLEGYGLTETAPVLTLNPQDRPKLGTVGKAIPDVELRIVEPNAEGVGEIAARGPNVMRGYYNAPEATAAAFDDGWFLTGDLGFLDADGYLTITGRKKNLIVNREGKNIYPEEVEQVILQSRFIRECLVLGYRESEDRVGEQVGAIVVPNQEELDAEAQIRGRSLTEAEVVELLRNEVKRVCAQIAEYKRPRHIQVRWEEFEKTSTGKIKRYLYAQPSKPVH